MVRKFSLLLTIIVLLSSLTASAQSLDEILAKYIEARGGMDKMKSKSSVKFTGKMMLPQGMEAPVMVQKKRPNSMRIEFTLQGMTGIQGYDGTTAWMIMPFMGVKDPQVMPEDDAKGLVNQADFDGPLVDYKDKGNQVELIGKEDVEGTPTYKLKITLKDGDIRYYYLDAENYLELKITSILKREGTEITVDTYLGDYKEIDGMMVPFAVENRIKDQTADQYTLENVEFDVSIDDSMFKMPAESTQSAPANQ